MTRGKWVALAVGVAVIAVVLPYGPAGHIWGFHQAGSGCPKVSGGGRQ